MIPIIVGAIIFSIWGVTLFFGKEIGLSMFLFVFPIAYFLIDLIKKNQKQKNRKASILILPILLLALTYVLFNNTFFNSINVVVIPVLVVIMIIASMNENTNKGWNWIHEIIEMIFEPLSFMGEVFEKIRQTIENKLKINMNGKRETKFKKVIKAILITLPIALVIIGLLVSADEIFGNMFMRFCA